MIIGITVVLAVVLGTEVVEIVVGDIVVAVVKSDAKVLYVADERNVVQNICCKEIPSLSPEISVCLVLNLQEVGQTIFPFKNSYEQHSPALVRHIKGPTHISSVAIEVAPRPI